MSVTGSALPADLAREDRQLKVGAEVIVFWPFWGFRYRLKGVITRLESLRAEVRLLTPLGATHDRPALHSLSVPRYSNFSEWSSGRCLRLEKG